jgi:hypothetical protein
MSQFEKAAAEKQAQINSRPNPNRPTHTPTKNQRPKIESVTALFSDLLLTDKEVNAMSDAEFLIPNVIVRSHLASYNAPANGGKSALFRFFCEELSAKGLNVMYINVDAGPGDLKRHHAHAKAHNYSVIAPDALTGKSADDVTKKLNELASSDADCTNDVIILDTLKKFVSVLNKSASAQFYQLLRRLTVRGCTVCLLGHTNKYKDIEGKLIFEGTADLRNDVDELIYFESILDEEKNVLEITTRPDKVRADFKPVSFRIDKNDGLKVTRVDGIINILPPEDKQIIDLCKWAIREGRSTQSEIVEFVKKKVNTDENKRAAIGDKKIVNRLKFYSEGNKRELRAQRTGYGKEVEYQLLGGNG